MLQGLIQTKLLKLIVQITYPLESLNWEEQARMRDLTLNLFFYGDLPDFEQRMTKAWRAGARAEFFRFNCHHEGAQVAGDKIGQWSKVF